MKTIYKIFPLFFIGILLTSCDGLVWEENYQDDPNTSTSVPTLNLISQAELTAIYLNESDASRYAGIASNYISGVQNQWSGYESYTFTPGDFDRLWSNIYVEGIKQARDAKIQAAEELDDDAIATANFLEAYFLGELAASYNNIPDSEAITLNNFNPIYDSQSSVFDHVQQLLDEVISLGNTSTIYITDSNGGTASSSTLGTLAHSLKARYYLIAKDYPRALTEAQMGISDVDGALFGTHNDKNGAQNLWFHFTFTARQGDTSPKNAYLQDLLRSANGASRLLVTPGETERTAFYFRPNENYNLRPGGIFDKIASLPIIGWHETKLILAEAAYRTGNEGLARTTLNEVRTALATQYGSSFPDSVASGNMLLLHILEEKYITLYPSAQTWHDLTRTNNALGIRVKTGTELPQRFIYPQSEVDANVNVPSPLPGLFVATNVNQ